MGNRVILKDTMWLRKPQIYKILSFTPDLYQEIIYIQGYVLSVGAEMTDVLHLGKCEVDIEQSPDLASCLRGIRW